MMTLKAFLWTALLSYALAQDESCFDHECTCADTYGEICSEPVAESEIHVTTIGECIENCNLFHDFGMCDWIMWYTQSNIDENCRMISNNVETMEKYLSTCRYVGQPLMYKPYPGSNDLSTGDCIPSVLTGECPSTYCPNKQCHDCSDNGCLGYAQAECAFVDHPDGESNDIPSYDDCQNTCSLLAQSQNLVFFKYDKESEICLCQNMGQATCTIELVKYGMTEAQIGTCTTGGGSSGCISDADCTDPSKPKCDQGSGECVQCLSDSDCTNPAEGLCDPSAHTCMAGCRVDTDCPAEDYCNKLDNQQIGSCTEGCRNPGSDCMTDLGEDGKCSGDHNCVNSGSPTLSSIEIQTTSCDSCSIGSGVASIVLTAILANGNEGSCSTSSLDVPGAGNVVFDQPETLDTCYLFESDNEVTEFLVTWTGPGTTWTPDTFKINWKGVPPLCCTNPGTTLTDGDEVSFNCPRCP